MKKLEEIYLKTKITGELFKEMTLALAENCQTPEEMERWISSIMQMMKKHGGEKSELGKTLQLNLDGLIYGNKELKHLIFEDVKRNIKEWAGKKLTK
ncbi:MAG: hypothetical protein NTW06_01685 [Candidatus Falkowbacteria bacterium]|nr:hypothetical protein [Candidatus Falkowbacteria bacterium]